MRVKIGDTWYDSKEEAICIEFDDKDKENIANMAPSARKYGVFPNEVRSSLSDEEMLNWMNDGPKQTEAYKKIFIDYGYNYEKLELTGRCKTRIGGPFPKKYYEYKKKTLFGGYKLDWISEDNVEFFAKEYTYTHKCNNGENNE